MQQQPETVFIIKRSRGGHWTGRGLVQGAVGSLTSVFVVFIGILDYGGQRYDSGI